MRWLSAVVLVACAGLALIFTIGADSPEESAWEAYEANRTLESARRYLEQFPDSERAETVKAHLEELAWRAVEQRDNIADLEEFVRAHPEGRWNHAAQTRLAELSYPGDGHEEVSVYRSYLERYRTWLRSSEYADRARRRIAELEAAKRAALDDVPNRARELRRADDLEGLRALASSVRGEHAEGSVWEAILYLLSDRHDFEGLLALAEELKGRDIRGVRKGPLGDRHGLVPWAEVRARDALFARWKHAKDEKTRHAAAAEFLRRYPKYRPPGRGVPAIEDHYWRATWKAEDARPYEEYLSLFPDGRYASKVTQVLADRPSWERARRENTLSAYESFLRAHPKSRFAMRARKQWVALRLEALESYTSGTWPDTPPGRIPAPAMVVNPDSGFVSNPKVAGSNWTVDVGGVRVLVVRLDMVEGVPTSTYLAPGRPRGSNTIPGFAARTTLVFVDLRTERILGTWKTRANPPEKITDYREKRVEGDTSAAVAHFLKTVRF